MDGNLSGLFKFKRIRIDNRWLLLTIIFISVVQFVFQKKYATKNFAKIDQHFSKLDTVLFNINSSVSGVDRATLNSLSIYGMNGTIYDNQNRAAANVKLLINEKPVITDRKGKFSFLEISDNDRDNQLFIKVMLNDSIVESFGTAVKNNQIINFEYPLDVAIDP